MFFMSNKKEFRSEQFILNAFSQLNEFRSKAPYHDFEYYDSLITVGQFHPLFQRLHDYFPETRSVLDWGCGNGHISVHLINSGHHVASYSLQPVPSCFSSFNLEQKSRHEFTQGDYNDPVSLPYASNSFDAVISCGVLEHVREGGGDELKSLQEIKRILKPGGVFICVAFPNKFSYIQNLNVLLFGWKLRKIPYTVKYHKYTYSKKQVFELCSAAGLEVIDYRRYGFLPRNIFRRFPESMRRSERVARTINRVDWYLEKVFRFFCTSHLFVAKKP